jgi:hypothetical protein
MSFEVRSVCYEAIGDEAKIVIDKQVVGQHWRIEATFPLQGGPRGAAQSEQRDLEQRVREEARRVLLEAADAVFN